MRVLEDNYGWLRPSTKRNHDSSTITSDFFNTIDPDRPPSVIARRFSPLGPRGILCSQYDVKSGSFKGSYDGKSHVSTVFFAPEDLVTCDAGGSVGMNDIGRHDRCVDNVKNLRFVHGRLPWSAPRYHETKRRPINSAALARHRHAESFWAQDRSGQTVGWFYFRTDPLVAKTAGVLLKDKARRMAVNFARLPELLGQADSG
jgi:hypothetical protein